MCETRKGGRRLYLFQQSATVNKNEIEKCYGIKQPERINGFAGVVSAMPDIFVTEELFELMKNNPSARNELTEIIRRIAGEDYGDINEEEREYNSDQRWLAGSYCDVVARFDLSFAKVAFVGYSDYAVIELLI